MIITAEIPTIAHVWAFFGMMPGAFGALFWTSGTALDANVLS
jgi:hypothetical protein